MTQSNSIDPRLSTDIAEATQWKLMWLKFRKHRLAMFGLCIVSFLYLIALCAEFFSPFDPSETSTADLFHPPQRIHFVDRAEDASWALRMYVYDQKLTRDPITLATTYVKNPDKKIYLKLFGKNEPYNLFGLIPMSRTLIAPATADEKFYLFGADRLGRDMFSRAMMGTRISMSIGLVGVTLSLCLGLLIGGLSGYFGGLVDAVSSRAIELILAMPTIPVWLGLSAALPATLDPLLRYFMITIILSLIGWTELARVVRGRFLALRQEDFVISAELDGAPTRRVIFRHMMPSLVSHIIASVTLAIPSMILAETSLSFLGLGLSPPTVSWGVLLKEAQNIHAIAQAPWLFIPGAFVALAVLSLNFLGDGLRDAADPYASEGS
ncbi:ABC transporter permease [uncultured Litoreibacter sp.]|uniref:ABC transporter permease n=1 Tax=uncultured Litoreibacter sp. TaxID=1392394 RepID=UPI0026038F04|nr:ABC transporter permease [uncultured Litoreibacter sp.]